MRPRHRVALVTGGSVFALVKGHDRVSGTHRVCIVEMRGTAVTVHPVADADPQPPAIEAEPTD